jgi:hypothetical protein
MRRIREPEPQIEDPQISQISLSRVDAVVETNAFFLQASVFRPKGLPCQNEICVISGSSIFAICGSASFSSACAPRVPGVTYKFPFLPCLLKLSQPEVKLLNPIHGT